MIQDIEPYTYHNEYRNISPRGEDYLICVRDRELLVREDSPDADYPAYAQLTEQMRRGKTFTYLFSVGSTRFFLCRDLELPGYGFRRIHDLRTAGPKHLVYAGMVGVQLAGWYERHHFCGRCGHRIQHDSQERMMRCPSCGQMEYPKICPCVIVGILHEDKILVTRYKGENRGRYALVAGFTEIGETIEETVHREVMEETGLHVKNLRYYKCQPWPYSESLLFGFFCELDGSSRIILEEDELAMAKWISREELDVVSDDFSLTNEMLCVFKEGIY